MKKSHLLFLTIGFIASGCGMKTTQSFNITWKVGDDSFTESYRFGETPVYKFGVSKPDDKTYSYKFKSWDKEISKVTKDETYTAIYDQEFVNYNVIWNIDGNVFNETYHYGDTPSLSTYKNQIFTYDNLEFYPQIKQVTDDISYVATSFNKQCRIYNVTFVVDNKSYDIPFLYGQEPLFPFTPVKEGTDEYSYNFIGWDKKLYEVDKDETYTAIFEQVRNKYNITFNLGSDVIVKQYEYGEIPSYEGIPVREENAKYKYIFKCWDKPFSIVNKDENYNAIFETQIKSYVINIYSEDGDELILSKILEFDSLIDKTLLEKEVTEEYVINGFIYNDSFYTSLRVNGNMDLFVSKKETVTVKVNHRINSDKFLYESIDYEVNLGEILRINNNIICGYYYPNQDFINVVGDNDKTIDIYYSELDIYDGKSIAPYFRLGTGSLHDPYRISSSNEFALFRKLVNEYTNKRLPYCFKLTQSIDLRNAPNFIFGEQVDTPTYYFDGTLYGNNCSIRGINITGNQCPALFTRLGSNGSIKDLSIYGKITGMHFTGGLVGRSYGPLININNYAEVSSSGANACAGIAGEQNNYVIENCTNYGKISMLSNHEKTGGICGTIISNSSLINCQNFGDVSGYKNVGGIIGHCYVSSSTSNSFSGVSNSYNFGKIDGYQMVAGIIGGSPTTAIMSFERCVNFNSIHATGSKVGGIFGGGATNHLVNCVNYGDIRSDIKGDSFTGGIAGQLQDYHNDGAYNLINYGNVTGNQRTGGIIGNLHQSLFDSFNYGTVSSNSKINSSWVGGICGVIGATVTIKNCINNGIVHNSNNNTGGIAGATANTEGIIIVIDSCTNNAQINGEGYSVGGILGTNNSGKTDLTVKNCTNNGTIVGGNNVGGIVGYSLVPVSCYVLEGEEKCINNGLIICAGIMSDDLIGKIS